MNAIEMKIEGVKIIELDVFGDEREWFFETYDVGRYRRPCISWLKMTND